jgi:hypothetical protein
VSEPKGTEGRQEGFKHLALKSDKKKSYTFSNRGNRKKVALFLSQKSNYQQVGDSGYPKAKRGPFCSSFKLLSLIISVY